MRSDRLKPPPAASLLSRKEAIVFDDIVKAFPGKSRRDLMRAAIPGGGSRVPVHAPIVIDHLSLTIGAGEAVGIIGPNGAGKSTLLRILAGIWKPTAGRVWHEGRLAAVIELGAVVQRDMTGRENLLILAAMLGLSRRAARLRLESMEEFTGLGDALDLAVREYSTGMAARLGFGVIAHFDADILAIDEALAVGDREFQDRCFEALRRHTAKGGTLVVVSHDLWALVQVCDRVVSIRDGKIIDDGPPAAVIERYLDAPPTHASRAAGVRIDSLVTDRERYDASQPITLTADIEIEERIKELNAVLTTSIPPFGPWGRNRHVISRTPVEAGRYRARITLGPIAFRGQARMAAQLALRAGSRLLAVEEVSLDFKEGSATRTMLPLPLQWIVQSAAIGSAKPRPVEDAASGDRVDVRDLVKRFRHRRRPWPRRGPETEELWLTALDRLTVRAGRGEMLGIIGPNGSGKSTLLRVLAGVTQGDAGVVKISDEVVALIELGLGFHNDLTGWENLRLTWLLLGLSADALRQSQEEIVLFADLEDRMDEPVRHWSTGMRARLGLSAVLHSGAEVILIDEVLSVGDQAFREAAVERLQGLVGLGTTCLFVSHDVNLVQRICDRVAQLDHGRVVTTGPASELAERLGPVDWVGTPHSLDSALRLTDLAVEPPEIDLDGTCEVSFRVECRSEIGRERVEFCLCERFQPGTIRDGTPAEVYDLAVSVETVDLPSANAVAGQTLTLRTTLGPLPLQATVLDVVVMVIDEDNNEVLSEVRRKLRLGRSGIGRVSARMALASELEPIPADEKGRAVAEGGSRRTRGSVD